MRNTPYQILVVGQREGAGTCKVLCNHQDVSYAFIIEPDGNCLQFHCPFTVKGPARLDALPAPTPHARSRLEEELGQGLKRDPMLQGRWNQGPEKGPGLEE